MNGALFQRSKGRGSKKIFRRQGPGPSFRLASLSVHSAPRLKPLHSPRNCLETLPSGTKNERDSMGRDKNMEHVWIYLLLTQCYCLRQYLQIPKYNLEYAKKEFSYSALKVWHNWSLKVCFSF